MTADTLTARDRWRIEWHRERSCRADRPSVERAANRVRLCPWWQLRDELHAWRSELHCSAFGASPIERWLCLEALREVRGLPRLRCLQVPEG